MNQHKSSSERMADALERARRHWQIRTPAAEPADVLAAYVPPAFTIAISREAGAQGPAIARTVGARLSWPVYDHELVERIAGEMGLRAHLLESVDEKRTSWLQEWVEAFASGRTVSESGYVRHLTETLFSLAAHGECVIVGRGAAQVLPAESTLRVRLVGPLRERIAAIRDRFDLTPTEAAQWVEKTDAARSRFVKEHFHKGPDDARLYDLVLNSLRFSVEECAELIIEALRRLQARSRKTLGPALVAGAGSV